MKQGHCYWFFSTISLEAFFFFGLGLDVTVALFGARSHHECARAVRFVDAVQSSPILFVREKEGSCVYPALPRRMTSSLNVVHCLVSFALCRVVFLLFPFSSCPELVWVERGRRGDGAGAVPAQFGKRGECGHVWDGHVWDVHVGCPVGCPVWGRVG